MNNYIKSISKFYLIILIPLASLLIINNTLTFAEDKQEQKQKQNVAIASDVKKDPSFFTFLNNLQTQHKVLLSVIMQHKVLL